MKACILTISDTRVRDTDETGKILQEAFELHGFLIETCEIVKDDKDQIQEQMINCIKNDNPDIIITTGGTGFSPRDITPEATREIIEREVPGISEFLRMQGVSQTKKSILSRGVSGIRGNTLIINLPGSVNAVKNAIDQLMDILPHAIEMIQGKGH